MTTETTTTAARHEDSKIEQTVKVYLEWDAVNARWTVDPVTANGHALDAEDAASNDLVAEYWTEADRADLDAANQAHLPNADQLVLLLLEALPEESTVKTAMAEVLEGAESWSNELTQYIAPSSAKYGEGETSQNQMDTANAITAAVELLRV